MTSQPPPTSPEIQLVDLEKRFREVRAVDGVSLDIHTGEFFSLLGPSGCGKTTTLRMIGGFELPTAGRILLRGRDVTDEPPDKRPVNMVFQNYALFPHLDVGDNVAFGLKRRSVAKPEIARRVGAALELVHLTGYERRNVTDMIVNAIDPNAYVREEYASFRIRTKDGQVLIGLITERGPGSLTLVDAAQQKQVIPRHRIADERAIPTSIMPEGLLMGLNDQELRDLFKYLSN